MHTKRSSWEPSGAILGDLGATVTHLRNFFGSSWAIIGLSWSQDSAGSDHPVKMHTKRSSWEPSGAHLGAELGHIGAILGDLEATVAHVRAIFGSSWAIFGLLGPKTPQGAITL